MKNSDKDSKLPIALAAVLALAVVGAIVYLGRSSSWQSREKKEWEAHDKLVESTDQELHELSAKVEALKGESKCNANEDCRIHGLGAPVCGLYKNFLIYSTLDTKEADLLQAVENFNSHYKKMLDMSLSPGSCGIKPAAVRCLSGHCEPSSSAP